jgi:hypothetical protein
MRSQGGAIVLRVSTLFLAFLPKRGMPAYGREIVRSEQKANRVVPVENVAVPNTPSKSDSDGSRPVPPAGSTRFAPDPVCKMKKSKQKKCEGRQAKAIHKF